MDRLMLTAGEIAQGVRNGEFSASEVFEAALKRAKALEPSLSALISFSEDRGRAAALRVDEAVARGEDPGLLAGVPVVLKDNICLEGTPTTCGSRMLEGWIPPYDAAVVTELEAAGAAILGREHGRVRHGGSTDSLPSGRRPTRGTPAGFRGAAPEGAPCRWPPGTSPCPSAAIREGPYGSLRRTAASTG